MVKTSLKCPIDDTVLYQLGTVNARSQWIGENLYGCPTCYGRFMRVDGKMEKVNG